MAKRIWEFPELSEIGDNTLFLVSDGKATRTVPGSLINLIDARISNIIQGTATEVSASEIVDARLQANGVTAATLGDAIRWGYNAAIQAMYYRPGDTINIGRAMCAGCLTGSGSTIGCYIRWQGQSTRMQMMEFTNPGSTAITVRPSGGGYLLQNIKINQLNEMGTINFSVYENGIEFQYVDASTFSATNNVPVQVTFSSLKLTVS